MIRQASGSFGPYSIRLRAYRNCDDVFLCWRTFDSGESEKPIPDTLGFMIERRRKDASGNWLEPEILRNRVGFKDTSSDGNAATSQPSNIWPFQRCDWTDHGANSGQIVEYRISPMKLPVGGTAGTTKLDPIFSSAWTGIIRVDAMSENGVSAFFNRGTVMSQYVARIMRLNNWTPQELTTHLADLQEPLRRFLSGELRLELLRLLDEAIDNFSLSIYAALYELDDDELIQRLKKLKGRAHVLLSNGSDPVEDGNATAADELHRSIDLRRRMLAYKGLGHNKFLILYDRFRHKALKAWTGSTNWSTTGLCTQLNNGILFEDEQIAAIYMAQWKALEGAQSGFTPTLLSGNNASPHDGGNRTSIWFTRVGRPAAGHTWARDIEALVDVVNRAREMILYVMFSPGEEPLKSILQKGASGIYVRGVVNTVSSALEETFSLAGLSQGAEYHTELIQPEGVGQDLAGWIEEVTRTEFLYPIQNPGVGHAITHAKMIVIDPWTDHCRVITGSHNFSKSASLDNDDNFVIIEGNQELAEAYAVACMSTYEHYRWRAYLKDKVDAGEKPWSHLGASPSWQNRYLASTALKKHLELWCRDASHAAVAPA